MRPRLLHSSFRAHNIKSRSTLQLRDQSIGNGGRCLGNGDARGLERFDFSGGSSFPAGNDCTRVTHSATGRRRHPRDNAQAALTESNRNWESRNSGLSAA